MKSLMFVTLSVVFIASTLVPGSKAWAQNQGDFAPHYDPSIPQWAKPLRITPPSKAYPSQHTIWQKTANLESDYGTKPNWDNSKYKCYSIELQSGKEYSIWCYSKEGRRPLLLLKKQQHLCHKWNPHLIAKEGQTDGGTGFAGFLFKPPESGTYKIVVNFMDFGSPLRKYYLGIDSL